MVAHFTPVGQVLAKLYIFLALRFVDRMQNTALNAAQLDLNVRPGSERFGRLA